MIKKVPVLGGIIEEVAEELKDTGKDIVKQVGRVPGDAVQSAVSQTAGIEQPQKEVSESIKRDEDEITKHLYSKTKDVELKPEDIVKQKAEDKKELAKKRAQLSAHQKYYQSLTTPRPKADRPAEKVEREKKEDRWKLEEQKAKKKPIIVQRAQQSVEKYRGTAG